MGAINKYQCVPRLTPMVKFLTPTIPKCILFVVVCSAWILKKQNFKVRCTFVLQYEFISKLISNSHPNLWNFLKRLYIDLLHPWVFISPSLYVVVRLKTSLIKLFLDISPSKNIHFFF